jgi:hypothetical protein
LADVMTSEMADGINVSTELRESQAGRDAYFDTCHVTTSAW